MNRLYGITLSSVCKFYHLVRRWVLSICGRAPRCRTRSPAADSAERSHSQPPGYHSATGRHSSSRPTLSGRASGGRRETCFAPSLSGRRCWPGGGGGGARDPCRRGGGARIGPTPERSRSRARARTRRTHAHADALASSYTQQVAGNEFSAGPKSQSPHSRLARTVVCPGARSVLFFYGFHFVILFVCYFLFVFVPPFTFENFSASVFLVRPDSENTVSPRFFGSSRNRDVCSRVRFFFVVVVVREPYDRVWCCIRARRFPPRHIFTVDLFSLFRPTAVGRIPKIV